MRMRMGAPGGRQRRSALEPQSPRRVAPGRAPLSPYPRWRRQLGRDRRPALVVTRSLCSSRERSHCSTKLQNVSRLLLAGRAAPSLHAGAAHPLPLIVHAPPVPAAVLPRAGVPLVGDVGNRRQEARHRSLHCIAPCGGRAINRTCIHTAPSSAMPRRKARAGRVGGSGVALASVEDEPRRSVLPRHHELAREILSAQQAERLGWRGTGRAVAVRAPCHTK